MACFRSATSLGETGQAAAARDAYATLYSTARCTTSALTTPHPDYLQQPGALAGRGGGSGGRPGPTPA